MDRPGRPFLFTDRQKKNTKLVEEVEILLYVKFSWIPFSNFRGEFENVWAKIETNAVILFFGSAQKFKFW